MDLITLILSVTTLIFGGGWFVNYRQKKQQEQASADSAKLQAAASSVDLAEKVAQQYNALVLSSMGDNAKDHERMFKMLCELSEGYGNISEYLNGEYKEYLKGKKKK